MNNDNLSEILFRHTSKIHQPTPLAKRKKPIEKNENDAVMSPEFRDLLVKSNMSIPSSGTVYINGKLMYINGKLVR